jgi:hypothetical protein
MWILIFYTIFVRNIFLILRKIERDIILNVHRFTIKVPIYYCQILIKFVPSRQIFKNNQMLNLIKIRLEEVELFHADRQTDGQTDWLTGMTKLTVAFRNFSKEQYSRNYIVIILLY